MERRVSQIIQEVRQVVADSYETRQKSKQLRQYFFQMAEDCRRPDLQPGETRSLTLIRTWQAGTVSPFDARGGGTLPDENSE